MGVRALTAISKPFLFCSFKATWDIQQVSNFNDVIISCANLIPFLYPVTSDGQTEPTTVRCTRHEQPSQTQSDSFQRSHFSALFLGASSHQKFS